ncbi:MAG: hypothetical protein L7W43_07785, partial [Rubripirellula sp.]|nr:hypothetical protein [Rubripirellula sp.]
VQTLTPTRMCRSHFGQGNFAGGSLGIRFSTEVVYHRPSPSGKSILVRPAAQFTHSKPHRD